MMETPVEQCRRDVAEGIERIERQTELVAHLERYGHARMLREAQGLLATLQHMQQLATERLVHEGETPLFERHRLLWLGQHGDRHLHR